MDGRLIHESKRAAVFSVLLLRAVSVPPTLAPSRSRCCPLLGVLTETAGDSATNDSITATNEAQLAAHLTPLGSLDGGREVGFVLLHCCRRGLAISNGEEGKTGASLLLVVRFCFGLLHPRSLAPLGKVG